MSKHLFQRTFQSFFTNMAIFHEMKIACKFKGNMEYSFVKSNMLELNETQTRILKALLDIQMQDSENEKGITSYAIRNQGIPGKTFNTNKDVLLYHQLIRIINEEKTGKQRRIYYELTPVGFFGLMKSLADGDSKVLKKYVKFIPYLGSNWTKYDRVLKPYQFLLPRLLKRAIDEINLNTHFRLHTEDYKYRPRIEEITKLIFEDRGLEIKLSELYYPSEQEKKGINLKTFLTKKERIWRNLFSKDSIQLSEHMINRLIFLFYFNAFKLEYDDRFGFHIFNDFHVSEFDEIPLEIPENQEEKEHEGVKQDIQKRWNEYDKFWRATRHKFLDEIYKDVFDDNDFFFIFAENFSVMSKGFVKPTIMHELHKTISGKMIKEGIKHGIIKRKDPKDSSSESKN